jgi:hypothetical protein
MAGLVILAIIIAGLVTLDVLALRVGVDTTPTSTDPARPAPGITI